MSAVEITVVPVTAFAQNCALIRPREGEGTTLVDPGGEADKILAAIAKTGARVARIVLTHGHIDHAGAAAELAERLDVPVIGPHEADAFLLAGLEETGAGLDMAARSVTPNRWLADGDILEIAGVPFTVRHTPGHTPGHVVFISEEFGLVIGGDVLFAGSVGRTDFPYGDHDSLIRAIRTVLLPLDDAVTVLPGHGPTTTIGRERAGNPFLR